MNPRAENESSGDTELAHLYVLIRPELQRAGRRVDPNDEGDLAQETFLRLVRVQRRTEVANPLALLRTTARHLLIDRLRGCRRQAALFDPATDGTEIASDSADPERQTIARQQLEIAFAVIAALPSRCRQAFELHRLEQLTYREIAARMGISISAVEKHIAEGAARLSRELARREEEA